MWALFSDYGAMQSYRQLLVFTHASLSYAVWLGGGGETENN